MRILFVADGRSPTALNWIRYWVERGDEVALVSTFACAPSLPLLRLELVPVAFSGSRLPSAAGALRKARRPGAILLRTVLRQWAGFLTLPSAVRRLEEIAAAFRPDLVHAMRIPYEGILAARAALPAPLALSTWGNDFTLHAHLSPWMGAAVRHALRAAAGLHSDCRRDLRLAGEWGFAAGRPSLVVPGNGGIRSEFFSPPQEPVSQPVVVNPRGFRGYVRNDAFFRSIPLILQDQPQTRFLCVAMAGVPEAEEWVRRLGVEAAVDLLAPRSHPAMAEVFRSSRVVVSPSTHDGTPNTLLEAMACGCFPVAGDLESIREWIDPGENGLLVDPADPQALARATLTALKDDTLRIRALKQNVRLIAERAEYRGCMAQAETFYARIRGT